MGVIIPADYGVLSFHTRTTGDPEDMIWTLGVGIASAAVRSDIPEMARVAWEDRIAPLTSSVVTLVTVELKEGPSATGPTWVSAGTSAGTQPDPLPPPNCAVLVQKRSTLGGRKGRGRAYLPGISSISDTLDSGGNFGTGAADEVSLAMENLGEDLQTDTAAGPAIPVLLHSDATSPSTIVQYICSPKLATQRRRLRP